MFSFVSVMSIFSERIKKTFSLYQGKNFVQIELIKILNCTVFLWCFLKIFDIISKTAILIFWYVYSLPSSDDQFHLKTSRKTLFFRGNSLPSVVEWFWFHFILNWFKFNLGLHGNTWQCVIKTKSIRAKLHRKLP